MSNTDFSKGVKATSNRSRCLCETCFFPKKKKSLSTSAFKKTTNCWLTELCIRHSDLSEISDTRGGLQHLQRTRAWRETQSAERCVVWLQVTDGSGICVCICAFVRRHTCVCVCHRFWCVFWSFSPVVHYFGVGRFLFVVLIIMPFLVIQWWKKFFNNFWISNVLYRIE